MRALMEALLADRAIRIVDDEGRALTEHALARVPKEEVACQYPGSRQGMPLNGGALQQVNRYWTGICDDLRDAVPRHANLQQAFQVTLEMVTAAVLWPSGPLPARLAARYKACAGVCRVFGWLLFEEEDTARQPLTAMGSGTEFAAWVEGQGWLRGSHQVCAASARQIKTIFEIFCSGNGPAPGPSPTLEAAALQAALVLSTNIALDRQPADDSLGCRLAGEGRQPWLFGARARRGAAPEMARRFFSKKGRVGSLERFLAQRPADLSHQEREHLFWSVIPVRD